MTPEEPRRPSSLRSDFRLLRRVGYFLALAVSIVTLSLPDAVAKLGDAFLAAFGADDAEQLADGFTRYAPVTLAVLIAGLIVAGVVAATALADRLEHVLAALASRLPRRRVGAAHAERTPGRVSRMLARVGTAVVGVLVICWAGLAFLAAFAAVSGIFVLAVEITRWLGFDVVVEPGLVWTTTPGFGMDKLFEFPWEMIRAYADAYGWPGFVCAVAIGLYIVAALLILLRHAHPAAWRRRAARVAGAWSQARNVTAVSASGLFRFERNLLGGILAVWVWLCRAAVDLVTGLTRAAAGWLRPSRWRPPRRRARA